MSDFYPPIAFPPHRYAVSTGPTNSRAFVPLEDLRRVASHCQLGPSHGRPSSVSTLSFLGGFAPSRTSHSTQPCRASYLQPKAKAKTNDRVLRSLPALLRVDTRSSIDPVNTLAPPMRWPAYEKSRGQEMMGCLVDRWSCRIGGCDLIEWQTST